MTPITVYRKHPFYDLTKTLVHGASLGLLQGILIGLFSGDISLTMLMGINSTYFLFNMLGANFRHSHIWLGYGRVLEHIFISPAQHQIHHSLAPEHHNKNYGEVLALWDWIFGTLYVAKSAEVIEFGLGDAFGNRLRQRHDSLTAALVVPFKDSWRQIRKRLGFLSPEATQPVPPAE
jgi:sterol desaturase/sphingolipid hydroxylase (fatty acid hydroxylase superfamily)